MNLCTTSTQAGENNGNREDMKKTTPCIGTKAGELKPEQDPAKFEPGAPPPANCGQKTPKPAKKRGGACAPPPH